MASTLEQLNGLLDSEKWPTGFAKTILDSKEQVAFRFVIIDNSRSMLKKDGHRLTTNEEGNQEFGECSRWQEIISSMEVMINHAEMADTPTEIRLLNRSQPVIIGQKNESSWWNPISQLGFGQTITAARELLATEPVGLTPVCKQIREVSERLRGMEQELRASGKIALLIIATDGESTDGNVVDMLKPLEGLPLQIIIRMCTDEKEISEYWHNINASVDVDIRVLDDVEAEAVEIVNNNAWLTYGEPLHRAREFGVMIPAIDVLGDRLLSRMEIKVVCEILLSRPGPGGQPQIQPAFPNPETNWVNFVAAVRAAQAQCPLTFCPVKKAPSPWVDLEALSRYIPDPVRAMIDQNELTLWNVYLYYAVNGNSSDETSASGTPTKSLAKLKELPVFRSTAKYDKRLLHQDDFWQCCQEMGWVPSAINAIKFNKEMSDLATKRGAADTDKIKVSFREFIRTFLKFGDMKNTKMDSSQRMLGLLDSMDRSGMLQRIQEVEGSSPMRVVRDVSSSTTTSATAAATAAGKAEQDAKAKAALEAKLLADKNAEMAAAVKLKAEKEAKELAERNAAAAAAAKAKAEQEAKAKAEREAKELADRNAAAAATAKAKAEQEARDAKAKADKIAAEQQALKIKAEQEAKARADAANAAAIAQAANASKAMAVSNAQIQAEKEKMATGGGKSGSGMTVTSMEVEEAQMNAPGRSWLDRALGKNNLPVASTHPDSQLYQSAYQDRSGNVTKTTNPLLGGRDSHMQAAGGGVGARGGKVGEIPLSSSRPTTCCGSIYSCLCCTKQDGLLTNGTAGNRGGVSYQALETGDSLIDNDNDKLSSDTSCCGNCVTLFRFTVLVLTAFLVAVVASYENGFFSPTILGYDDPKDAPYLYVTRYASRSILKFNRDGELLSSNVLGSDGDIAAIPTATSLRSMVVHPYKNIPKALYVAVAGLAADSPTDQSSIMVFGPEDKNHQRVYLDTIVSAVETPGAYHAYGITFDDKDQLYASFEHADAVFRFRPVTPSGSTAKMMVPSTAPYLWENYLSDGSDPAAADSDSAFTTRPHKRGYGKRVAGNFFNGTFVQFGIPGVHSEQTRGVRSVAWVTLPAGKGQAPFDNHGDNTDPSNDDTSRSAAGSDGTADTDGSGSGNDAGAGAVAGGDGGDVSGKEPAPGPPVPIVPPDYDPQPQPQPGDDGANDHGQDGGPLPGSGGPTDGAAGQDGNGDVTDGPAPGSGGPLPGSGGPTDGASQDGNGDVSDGPLPGSGGPTDGAAGQDGNGGVSDGPPVGSGGPLPGSGGPTDGAAGSSTNNWNNDVNDGVSDGPPIGTGGPPTGSGGPATGPIDATGPSPPTDVDGGATGAIDATPPVSPTDPNGGALGPSPPIAPQPPTDPTGGAQGPTDATGAIPPSGPSDASGADHQGLGPQPPLGPVDSTPPTPPSGPYSPTDPTDGATGAIPPSPPTLPQDPTGGALGPHAPVAPTPPSDVTGGAKGPTPPQGPGPLPAYDNSKNNHNLLRGASSKSDDMIGQLWIANSDVDAIVVVDTLGRYVGRVLVTSPLGLTFCPKQKLVFVGSKKGSNNQGAVYGIDPITRTIVKTFVLPAQALASGQGLDHPAGLTIHGNILYVAEQSSNAVITFDITTTQFLRQIIDLNNVPTLGDSNGEVIEQLTLTS